jgi:hypothetical protein
LVWSVRDAAQPDRRVMLEELGRGLGSGYLKARQADRQVAADAFLACLEEDPRWDHQLDRRGWYYGSLAVELGVGPALFPPPDAPNVIPTLARMAGLADEAALAVLRSYVAEGEQWEWALSCMGEEGADVTGLDAVGLARCRSDDALGRALARATPERSPQQPRTKRRPLGEMRVAELLAQPDVGNRRIVRQLVERAGDEELIRAVHAWNPLAIRAAGERGLPDVLELVDGAGAPHARARAALSVALAALPFSLTRDRAHAWLGSSDPMNRRRGSGILAAHAGDDDAPGLRSAMALELALDADADQYVICSIAQALGRASAPSAELRDAFYAMRYSYGRHFVAHALAVTEPDFQRRFADEIRLDCEAYTRELAPPA